MSEQTKYRIRLSLMALNLILLGIAYFLATRYNVSGMPWVLVILIALVLMLFIREMIVRRRRQIWDLKVDLHELSERGPVQEETPRLFEEQSLRFFESMSPKEVAEDLVNRILSERRISRGDQVMLTSAEAEEQAVAETPKTRRSERKATKRNQ